MISKEELKKRLESMLNMQAVYGYTVANSNLVDDFLEELDKYVEQKVLESLIKHRG